MKPHLSSQAALGVGLLLVFAMACGATAVVPSPPPATLSPTLSDATIIAPPSSTPPLPTVPSLPPPASRVPGEVTGSVLLEQGRSASGGVAGTTIQVEVDLTATSTAGRVTAMRLAPVGGCNHTAQLESAAWQAFAPVTHLPASLAINWIGFYVAAQFRDDQGNLSPVYCDDISLEGMPAQPAVNPTEWYSQIQCFSEADVHPSQGETVTGPSVTFTWPGTNTLPDGVFYQVYAFSAVDSYTGLAAGGRTRDTSIMLQIPAEKAGDIVWYVVLTDANGTFLDHGRCSSFPPSLLTVDPPSGIKGVHFTYKP